MKRLLLLTALILTIGLTPILFHFGHDWLECDFIAQQIPFILETKRLLATGAPWWSWNTFVGDNFIGAYSFYTATSPFVWFACLFPADKLLIGILIALYLKTFCTAAFAYAYLRKIDFSPLESTIGALLYCFSSFYIANLYYYHFCEPVMMFPLLLIAIEAVIKGSRYGYVWLALATFGVIFINFYFALPSLLLGMLYFLFRAYALKRLKWSLILPAAVSVVVGIGLAAFILLPAICHNAGGARSAISLADMHVLGTLINATRSLIMPAVAEEINGFQTTNPFASFQAFVTLFGVFPTILYCCRNRKSWLTKLIILLLIIFYLPILNGVFSAYTNIGYTRWLYGLLLFMIVATLYTLRHLKELKRKWLFYYIAFTICTIAIALVFNHIYASGVYIPSMSCELALYVVNIALLACIVLKRSTLRTILLCVCVCSGLNLFATIFLYSSQANHRSTTDILYRTIFAQPLQAGSPTMHYRTDIISAYRNAAMMENKPGLISHHSSMNKEMLPLRATVHDNLLSVTFCISRHRDSFATLFSVKEVEDYHDSFKWSADYDPQNLTKIETHPDYNLYHNKNYIPLGFTYDSYITESDLQPYLSHPDSVDLPLLMLDNIVIDDKDEASISKLLPKGSIDLTVNLDSLAHRRRRTTATDFLGTSTGFSCHTDFAKPEVLFFSVPADKGFTAFIDGKEVSIYKANLSLTAIEVPQGSHTITFRFLPQGLKTGAKISVLSLLFLLIMILAARRRLGAASTRLAP